MTTTEFPDAGTLIGGVYRVSRPLGCGGMGVVVAAHDEALDRDVAIKLIRRALVTDRFVQQFRIEAQAMARVNHPNVVQIYACGEHEGAPYLVMERVEGVSLEEWVERNGAPDIATILTLLGQIVDGVAAIHAAKTVHRDLKPGNILVDVLGHARIADFGLAVRQGEEISHNGNVVGTPSYMAPEIAFPCGEDAAVWGERADVYALACIAYELFTGRLPFVADDHQAMLVQHAVLDPVPPSHLRPELSTELDVAVLRAMAKNPADRTPTAAAFGAALRAAHGVEADPAHILIADDSDDSRELLGVALRLAFPHAEIECVENGRRALQSFDRARPSVAILDLLMPELDGMELTALLRSRDPEARTPIIIVSASGGPTEWQRAKDLGADRFMLKPIVLDDVVAVVRRLVCERSLSRHGTAPPPPAAVHAG